MNSYKLPRKEALYTSSASALEPNRFVDLTKSTMTTAYSTYGSDPDGRTVARSSLDDDGTTYRTSMDLVNNLTQSFWVSLASAVTTAGSALVCVSNGQVAPSSYNIVNRITASDPSSGLSADYYYIVPSAGWGGLHGNAIAFWDDSESTWTYTDMSTSTAGTVVFDILEGRYYVWSGTAWTLAKVVCYAETTGAANTEISAYRTKSENKLGRDSLPYVNYVCIGIGTSTSETDSDAACNAADLRVAATDVIVAYSVAATNAVNVKTTTPSTGAIAFVLTGNGGANTVVSYAIFRALS
jgi:hypothetical protein